MYHVQLSIRNTYLSVLVVGIWLCVGIYLMIQGWYSREEGREGRREEERERERKRKREKNTESKWTKRGGGEESENKPFGYAE